MLFRREKLTDRPALLLLHMFAGSGLAWAPVVQHLPGLQCLTPDLRGFGAAAPSDPGATLADWADEAAGLAAPLGRFVLVGHSMGGKIATLLASRRPAGLAGLVLVAPSPPTPEPIPDRAAMLSGFRDPAAAARTAREISAHHADPVVMQRIVEDNLRTSHPAWTWWVERGSREDISGLAAAVSTPVLVVGAADDANIPPALLRREVVARVPGATLTTLPDSRHMVPLDAPGPLAQVIGDWLGGV